MTNSHYEFGDFSFDPDGLALYYREELIKDAEKKLLEVLASLLRNGKNVTRHEEIIDRVWSDNPHGVTSARINQYVSKLQKLFSKYETGSKYIENIKGRGYRFVGDVTFIASDTSPVRKPDDAVVEMTIPADDTRSNAKSTRLFSPWVIVGAVTFGLFTLGFAVWNWYPKSNDEAIRRVVKESQLFESLVLYKNPASYNESDLDKYWTAELEINSNYDRQRIRDAVKKLLDEGRRYGNDTKCEQFEFQSVEINADNTMAVVKTLEKWFIAVYFNDGTLQKNKTVGPYFVSYFLRRVEGRWLIEKSSTARVNRPTPRLSDVTFLSAPTSGAEFLVTITGQDFEPEMVYVEVIGPGCPESKPCRVPNSALREESKVTDTVLDGVPLTLASGEFMVSTRNGESPASNQLFLKIP